jgi:hypothetical protein
LEEIKLFVELRVAAIKLYENIVSIFWNTKGCSEEINYNLGVNQGCPLSPTLFGIYIDKLQEWLEEVSCDDPTLIGIVIIILPYADDIVLIVRTPHNLESN